MGHGGDLAERHAAGDAHEGRPRRLQSSDGADEYGGGPSGSDARENEADDSGPRHLKGESEFQDEGGGERAVGADGGQLSLIDESRSASGHEEESQESDGIDEGGDFAGDAAVRGDVGVNAGVEREARDAEQRE